jgi:hypothetical protein
MRMLMYVDHQTGRTVQRWVETRGSVLVDADTLEPLACDGEVAFCERDHVEPLQLARAWKSAPVQQPGRSAAGRAELL